MAKDELDINVPIVIRLRGTNEEKGRNLLSNAGLIVANRTADAIQDAVNYAYGEA
jgi:succinyl-CoA synthetase beta subunit